MKRRSVARAAGSAALVTCGLLATSACSGTTGTSAAPALPQLTAQTAGAAPAQLAQGALPVVQGPAALEAFVPPASVVGVGFERQGGSSGLGTGPSLALCSGRFSPSEVLRTAALDAFFTRGSVARTTVDLTVVGYRESGAAKALAEASAAAGTCATPGAAAPASGIRTTITPLHLSGIDAHAIGVAQTSSLMSGGKVVRSATTLTAFIQTGTHILLVSTSGGTPTEQLHRIVTVDTWERERAVG